MNSISYARFQFSPTVIQHAVWLYLRFNLSLRDVEDLLAERGLDVNYETIRRWVARFGTTYARRLRAKRPRADDRWHLDEMFVSIGGRRMYLWRAVDAEGEVLDVLLGEERPVRGGINDDRLEFLAKHATLFVLLLDQHQDGVLQPPTRSCPVEERLGSGT